ncbi:hypothetical protein GCM10009120_51230 [Sphingobacterium siyangense subsp. cladoniae]
MFLVFQNMRFIGLYNQRIIIGDKQINIYRILLIYSYKKSVKVAGVRRDNDREYKFRVVVKLNFEKMVSSFDVGMNGIDRYI